MISYKRIFCTASGNVIGVVDEPRWFKRIIGGQSMVRIGLVDPSIEHPDRPPIADFQLVTESLLEFFGETPSDASRQVWIDKLKNAQANVHQWGKPT